MAANVEIISREMIKPSSPQPYHLRNLKLSFLDQIAPPIYTPLIFFYHSNHTHSLLQISQSLKQSLSSVLTQFYPLAGRLSTEDFTVDCNDSGALFIEAKIHANLTDIIDDPNMEAIKHYLPLGPNGRDSTEANTLLLALQINVFDCGGIAVAVQMSHKIADGISLVNFMNAWAATCRGGSGDDAGIFLSGFNLATFFPPTDLSSSGFAPSTGIVTKEKVVTKRFVFDKEKLAKLKKSESSKVQDPTRVEVVSAFFWRHFIKAVRAKDPKKAVAAIHAVNLRPRMNPALPNHAFGNAWRHTLAPPAAVHEEERTCPDLVGDLRIAIRKINGDYVKKIQSGGEYYVDSLKEIAAMKMKGEIEICNFSSWCRFPVYEVDYGWAKPTWVCTTTLPFKNVVILMSTSCGEGIEAWVNMLEEDASSFIFAGIE